MHDHHMKQLPLLIAAAFSCSAILAQEKEKSSYFHAGVDYQSNSVYLGRSDSARLPYLTPSVGYYHSSGLYAQTSLSYLAASGSSRVDLYNVEAGYNFKHNNLSGDLAVSKYFYNQQSENVRSSVNWNTRFDLVYTVPDVVNFLGGAGIDFGTYTDYTASIAASHVFSLLDDDLEISPAITLNAGSQNFYKAYQSKKENAAAKKRRNKNPVLVDISQASAFRLLDYEFSVPVSYDLDKFGFNAALTYALPVNPAIIDITIPATGNHRSVQESLANKWFFTAGVTYAF
jgi:Bacterial protein of unknown function (Gcw_chp)